MVDKDITIKAFDKLVDDGTLIKPRAAAQLTGYSSAWIYKLIENGDLWSISVGGAYWVRASELTKKAG